MEKQLKQIDTMIDAKSVDAFFFPTPNQLEVDYQKVNELMKKHFTLLYKTEFQKYETQFHKTFQDTIDRLNKYKCPSNAESIELAQECVEMVNDFLKKWGKQVEHWDEKFQRYHEQHKKYQTSLITEFRLLDGRVKNIEKLLFFEEKKDPTIPQTHKVLKLVKR